MRAALRRVIQLVVVLLCVSFFSFALLSLAPGDPVVAIVGFASPAQTAVIRHQLHFDRPFLVQYWDVVERPLARQPREPVLRPDGRGARCRPRSVRPLPVSLQLMLYAMILTILIAIPLGVLAAYRAGTRTDKVINIGRVRVDRPARLRAGADPLVLGRREAALAAVAGLRRIRRTTSSTHLQHHGAPRDQPRGRPDRGLHAAAAERHDRDAAGGLHPDGEGKGITNRRILWRHALRPSSLTLLTVAGLNVGALIGGTVVIEIIFGLPAWARSCITAIAERQYVMLQSLVVGDRGRLRARERLHRHPLLTSSTRGCAMLASSPSTIAETELAARAARRGARSPIGRWRRPRVAAPRHRCVARPHLDGDRDPGRHLHPADLPLERDRQRVGRSLEPGLLQVPSHPLGFDRNGNDMLLNLAKGARNSMVVGVGAVAFGLARRRDPRLDRRLLQAWRRRRAHDALQHAARDPAVRARAVARHGVRARRRSTARATSIRHRRSTGCSC